MPPDVGPILPVTLVCKFSSYSCASSSTRYQNELPKKIKSRGKDQHLTHEELVQTIKWKLAVSLVVSSLVPEGFFCSSDSCYRVNPKSPLSMIVMVLGMRKCDLSDTER